MAILKLKPSGKDYIWGGHKLVDNYGKEMTGDRLAETWELSCHPDGPSFVANGEDAGKTLRQYIEEHGKKVLGTNCERFEDFPILTKFIDAQDNPLHEIVSRKLYEVQPYVSLTDATYTPLYMAMSKTVWGALSDSQKELIKEAAEVGRKEQFDLTDKAQAEALQTLKDNGVTVTEDVDKEAFQEIAKQQWSVFTDACGTELLGMIQADK